MKLLSGQRILGISMLANTTTFLIEIQINYLLSEINVSISERVLIGPFGTRSEGQA